MEIRWRKRRTGREGAPGRTRNTSESNIISHFIYSIFHAFVSIIQFIIPIRTGSSNIKLRQKRFIKKKTSNNDILTFFNSDIAWYKVVVQFMNCFRCCNHSENASIQSYKCYVYRAEHGYWALECVLWWWVYLMCRRKMHRIASRSHNGVRVVWPMQL